MTQKTVTIDAVLTMWDTGEIVAEYTDDETIDHIAKSLKIDAETVRAVLLANDRIEEA